MLAVLCAQEFVLDVEVRHDAVGLLLLPRHVGVGYGVTDGHHILQLRRGEVAVVRRHARHRGVHQEVLARIVVIAVVAIDAGIGSHRQGHGEQRTVRTVVLAAAVGVVLQVIGIGQRKVGREAYAVAHVVVQHQAGGETVEALLDDGTRLVVVAARNTEGCLLTTTRNVHVGLMLLTELRNLLHPVGVLVPVVGLGPRLSGDVVNLVDGRGGRCTLRGVIELLLEHHGVVVTVQQVITAGHPGAGELIPQRHTGLAAYTALGGNLDDTVGTLRTPDGGSGSILQDGDAGNIVDADGQQRGEGLLVGTLKVDVRGIIVKYLVVNDNQRLGTAVQRRDTTQAHGSTGTEVT